MKKNQQRFATGWLALLLAGCTATVAPLPQRTENSIDHIGIVRLSLGQPIPLDDKFREALRPDFKLTGEQAYDRSLPTSMVVQRYLLDAITANLKVSGPSRTDSIKNVSSSTSGATGDGSTTTQTGADGAQSTTGTRTETSKTSSTEESTKTKERNIGDPSKITAPSTEDMKKTARATDVPDLSKVDLGSDPMLRYQNAVSLLAAVKTLNQMIDSLQAPKGWTPYVVPVRVSLLPNGRNLPYDLRSTLIFSGVKPSSKGISIVAKGAAPSARVIPLGMDNHDLLSVANAQDVARSFGLGVGWVAGLTGINADFGKLSQASESTRRADLHSLMTGGQIGENMIQVSFGAPATGESTYSAVERTYLMVLVVMLPDDATQLAVTGSNSFVHSLTGALVDETSGSSGSRDIARILDAYDVPVQEKLCGCTEIVSASKQADCKIAFGSETVQAQSGKKASDLQEIRGGTLRRVQQLAHYGRLGVLGKCTGFDESSEEPNAGFTLVNLAASLARTLDVSGYSKALVSLPPKAPEEATPAPVAPPSQTILLRDNAQATVGFVVGGTHLSSAKNISAILQVAQEKIAATSVEVISPNELRLTFPSIDQFVPTPRNTTASIRLKGDNVPEVVHRALYKLFKPQPEKKTGPDNASSTSKAANQSVCCVPLVPLAQSK